MAILSGDNDWLSLANVKTLILEHHMAAIRLGFWDMFKPLDSVAGYRTGLRDGSLPILSFFSELVLPLVIAKQAGNDFAVAALVREASPLLSKEVLSTSGDQVAQIAAAKAGVESLMALFTLPAQPSFLAVLKSVAQSKLFTIPDTLLPFVAEGTPDSTRSVDSNESRMEDGVNNMLAAVRSFLGTEFSQIKQYSDYVRDSSHFATHQGVKGLEFPRVLVILDDEAAEGFLFSFEKLFAVKERTATDLKNEQAGMDTSTDRTRRLLYVTCSRSQASLALVAYSSNPEAVRKTLLNQNWFEDNEVEFFETPPPA